MGNKKEKLKGCWVYGKYPALHILKNKKRKINQLLVNDNVAKFLESQNIELNHYQGIYEIVPNYEISKLTNIHNSSHQGIALKVLPIIQPDFHLFTKTLEKKQKSMVVILDQVVDPHNIGAIMRTAAAFGADAIIATKDNSPSENSTIVKSACGAFELIPYIQVTNLSSAVKDLKQIGYWVVGLTHNAEQDIKKASLDFDKTAIILGSEEKGIRKLSLTQCDLLVRINISQNVESLNVSNAAAITLHSISRNL